MSGGVDSSVAAALLLREGYEVVGCFMRLGSPGETLDELTPADEACPATSSSLKIGHQGCCSINDAADARLVAARLGVPFYVCNFKKDFGRIVNYFVDEYAAGRTPNPCVRCNDWLKFGKLHEYAKQINADFVASGHYARIDRSLDQPRLLKGVDDTKDQSYVLFGAPADRLREMLLPVGSMPKTEVRALAKEFALPVFDKPDSQEICFVPDNDYAGLVDRTRPDSRRPGPILDSTGKVVGEHQGQHRFTIGQRRGLSVALGYRIYVVGKDAASNTVTIGNERDLLVASCEADEANWLIPAPKEHSERRVWAKYRYNTDPVPALVRPLSDGQGTTPSDRHGRFAIEFETPQPAVAPGQALVLYDDEDPAWLLGGGWISNVHRAT
jgi:tRNA-uridine 2-sulfurtransferase